MVSYTDKMSKLLFTAVVISLAFICIVKESRAVKNNTTDQPKNSDIIPEIVIPIKDFNEQGSSTLPNIENRTIKNKTNDQQHNSDIAIQIDYPNESGPSNQQNTEPIFQPFEVVAPENYPSTQSSIVHKLPSELIKKDEKWQLQSGSEYSLVTLLCPKPQITDRETLKFFARIITTYPDMSRCLFVKHFQKDETQMCHQEPKLVVTSIKDELGLPVICGIKEHQQLVEAQYYNCGSEMNLKNYVNVVVSFWNSGRTDAPPYELGRYTMYQVCYDFLTKQTLWTKHTPLTPALIANQESPYKELSNEFQIEDFDDDASLLDLSDSTFSSLKNSYIKTDSTATQIFTMVPKEHMALLYWKKATTHMINSAPLSPEFIPLIKIINNTILQASNKLLTKSGSTLEIYTKAETKVSTLMNLVANFPFGIPTMSYFLAEKPINLFQPNIWYQFVYNRREKSGILIVLHNTRELLFGPTVCDIGARMPCEFEIWLKSPIANTLRNKTYCCKVSQTEIQHLFSIREIELKKSLNIQAIMNLT